ncbi:MAG TPA: nickel pincer cofactor biosynthesis protein LarC [Dehalococcoidia bacterium]|nr:nickel pincer cofactor biosynthesis protein LarC [Dehalococcoidia bacterium]
MTQIAYFDCFSGCSGDMLLGALLDAGLDLDTLKNGLAGLNIGDYELTAEKVQRSSITATKFNVIIGNGTHQDHRSLTQILQLIEESQLSTRVKEQSSDIFRRLGRVEANIHGIPVEEVHFHEIGAVDSIIDIVGTVFALECLKIERCYSSPLPAGSGSVATSHGRLPSPAPATLQLLADVGAPLTSGPEPSRPQGELVTPTGAALITSLATFGQPQMNITGIGYGAGSKDFEGWPNVVRVWLGEESTSDYGDELRLLETNIDDMNPQIYGYLMEQLFVEQAADVWFTPIQMKKNRPAIMLSVLAPAHAESKITEIIMRETSTLGIRVRPISRHIAQREIIEIDSSLGHVHAKIKRYSGDILAVSPEYDDCRRIALERDMPFQEVHRVVEQEVRQHLLQQNP